MEEIITSSNRISFNWKELWRFRELFYFFTWRDIKIKYKQTFLGFMWAILQPLIMMIITSAFIGRLVGAKSTLLPYPVFVFSGLLIWNVFSSGLVNASTSMINNATIIKKIYFPRIIIPISSIFVALFDLLMASILFVPILIYYKQSVSISALWMWPISLLVAVIGTMGAGCWLSALNLKYRDFRYVVPFLVQVLFFLTPIIYPLTLADYPLLKYIIVASPAYAAVELFRYPLTGVPPDQTFLFISLFSSVVFLAIGIAYFKKTEDFFADFA